MKSQLERIRPRPYYLGMISLVLVITLLVAALPGSSASAVKCKFKYQVQAGDTLAYIGFLYTVSWLKIAEANDLTPPYTITVGQVLCIPEGKEPTTDTTTTTTGDDTKKGPQLSAVPGVGSILVTVENFAAKTVYNVRVFPDNWSVSYKLGHFRTNKEGDFSDFFNLPSYVPVTPEMIVCVKNVWTDATSCVRVKNEFYSTWLSITCPPKEGR